MIRTVATGLAAAGLVVGLAACQTGRSASPFAGDLEALGTEPFWNVRIHGERIVLSRLERPQIVLAQSSRAVVGDRATWTGSTDGVAVAVTLQVEACSDGMSDRTWPMSAQVRLGSETLKGCAAPPRNLGDSRP